VVEVKAKETSWFRKRGMFGAIVCKKDGELLGSCSCLRSSKQEQKLWSMRLNMRTNNVQN